MVEFIEYYDFSTLRPGGRSKCSFLFVFSTFRLLDLGEGLNGRSYLIFLTFQPGGRGLRFGTPGDQKSMVRE